MLHGQMILAMRLPFYRCLACAALGAALGACAPLGARTSGADAELQSALESAQQARIDGEAALRIDGETLLRLQPGLSYVPAAQAGRLLRSIGERPRQGLLGVVIATLPDSTEMLVLYAAERPGGIPEIGFAGWQDTPQLARFRQ